MEIGELKETDDHVKFCKLLGQLGTKKIDVPDETYHEWVNNELKGPLHKIFVGKLNDEIIASISLLIEPRMADTLYYVGMIGDIVIDEAHRFNGYSTVLLNRAIECCVEHGCRQISVVSTLNNVMFYKRLGFIVRDRYMVKTLDT